MLEAGHRERSQPAPPHVLFEALTQPRRAAGRDWLLLETNEQAPLLLEVDEPHLVMWSSLWPERPDARVRFDLTPRDDSGTNLRWTLLLDPPAPDSSLLGHLRRRLNELINANLRYSLGQ